MWYDMSKRWTLSRDMSKFYHFLHMKILDVILFGLTWVGLTWIGILPFKLLDIILFGLIWVGVFTVMNKLSRIYRTFKVFKTLNKIGKTPVFTSLDKENKTVVVTLMRPSRKLQEEIESLNLKDSIYVRKFLKGKQYA